MKEIFKTKSFWFAFLLLSATIFVAQINFKRVYTSETQILIIPKSEKAALNSEKIIENFKTIPTTLAFFQRVSFINGAVVEKNVLEMPDYKKKDYWNSKIKIERISTSGILKIIGQDKDQSRAEIIGNEAVKEFLATAGFYYDIREDVDIRIIDRAITRYSDSTPRIILALESILLGFVVVFFSFSVSFFLLGKREEFPTSFPTIQEKIKNDDPKPIFEEEKPWFEVVKNEPEYNFYSKKASAPDNLPVAEQQTVQEIIEEEPEKIDETIMEDIEKTPITREATPEEVKERLNRLLSGRL